MSLPIGLVELDFKNLSAFVPVKDQYSNLGVRFEGAIAIQPSNPVFSPSSEDFVLIPSGAQTEITTYFRHPIRWIGARVIGTKTVILSAFDATGKLLHQVCTKTHQFLVSEDPDPTQALPQQYLEIKHYSIVKVVFSCSAPFVLDDLFFHE